MFLPAWSIWCVLLTLHTSAWCLEISGYGSDEVICSQPLSDCTMEDDMSLIGPENNVVDVKNITPYFKLCCRDRASCTLCLVIDTEIIIHPDKDEEDGGHSGHSEEDYSNETESNPKASVTMCYSAAAFMPSCKTVEFTVNHAAVTQRNQAKFSLVITELVGVSFSSTVMVYPSQSHLSRKVDVPSLEKVCSQELRDRVEECHVPRLKTVMNLEMARVELQFAGRNESLTSVCVQYEQNGKCQSWNRTTIPLHSVTPCMCLMVWDEDGQRSRRSLSCPFTKSDSLQTNVWQNVSVSVRQGQMNNYRPMLSWSLSAPCRLEGEVWPCYKELSCREMVGFKQQLANGTWKQNSKWQWEKKGVFENINLQRSPCVMVKVKGMQRELGPFCPEDTDRGRWSLLVVGVVLLLCLAVLIYYLLRDFVKKWVWSCHHGGFVKIDRKGHVVLLSPPDVDDGISKAVCHLGSQLCNQGFSVSVDQWSRKEQCTLGPVPWLHSQLLELNRLGGRVVLVLTKRALERAEEWTCVDREVIRTSSPYSDVFTASLFLIQADKQLGRAGERFLLVKFDSNPSSDRSLPELLQGLRLFQLPSQNQALFSELAVGGTGRRTWTGWKWRTSNGWREKTKEGPDQQKAKDCKYVGV
ncbi:interleukin-17 receptor C [Centropristis striata]|uniref:interleukin-17 receptor C n=1 Tax=Centropristis striata TaxID=184440 RepID=UPI0027E0B569|nr:interleukin-17 receptor C [Centropristis striata]